ncbi:IS66 family insertion sequence element accessory protein TnpB [Bradyrhizobium septentrionale]|uniref:IS66 family insertion sequence element accessory protein TnpB n=1 Tax=Bradyrhizobium septentrionale TaxID=1404411 RepID=A0A973VWZ4_9BRAD|nr:IS66 family insertion sequence element accessory protein TnpB [Bradyrhizobium septentrionale]UGY20344.1 IS66 family insertion sequence element accessory protein TnpB [Bradyrhizobium septentrionale]
MIPIPTGVRVWLATGHTDMRCGFPSLALRVQEVLKRDAMGGGLFCFRGKRGDLLKVIWHDGQGACLFVSAHFTAQAARAAGRGVAWRRGPAGSSERLD